MSRFPSGSSASSSHSALSPSLLSRSLPFLLFKPGASLPSYIRYLGKALPSAVFALLVVYCLKDVSLLSGNHGIPEAIRPPCDHAAPPLETADDALHGRRHDPLHGTCAVCVSLKGAENSLMGIAPCTLVSL